MRRMIPQKQIDGLETLNNLTQGSVFIPTPSLPDVLNFEVNWENSEAVYDEKTLHLYMVCRELGPGWYGEERSELPYINYIVVITQVPESVHDDESMLAWAKQGFPDDYIDEAHDDEYFINSDTGSVSLGEEKEFDSETMSLVAEVEKFYPDMSPVLKVDTELNANKVTANELKATTIHATDIYGVNNFLPVKIHEPTLLQPIISRYANTHNESYDVNGVYRLTTTTKLRTGHLIGFRIEFDSGETEQFKLIDTKFTMESMVYDNELELIYPVRYYNATQDANLPGKLIVTGKLCQADPNRTANLQATLYDKDDNQIPMTGAENTPKVHIQVPMY